MSNFNMGGSPDDRIRELALQKANRAIALENLRMNRSASIEQQHMSALLESQDAEANASIDRKDKLNSLAEKNRREASKREAFTLETRLVKEGTVACFETALFSMVYNSLPYPEDVKESLDVLEMSELVFSVYESVMETCKKTNKAATEKSNKLLDNIKEVCEACAKKAAKRITKKAIEENDEFSKINFELTEEEGDELTDNIGDLNIEQIEELIKQKVVKVVEDEQKASEQKAKAMDEINNAIDQAKDKEPEPAGDAGVSESAEVRLLNNKLNTLQSSFGNTIFESLFMTSIHEVEQAAVSESIDATQQDITDAAFLEAVVRYATIETMNTIGMVDFKRGNVAKEVNRSILKSLK